MTHRSVSHTTFVIERTYPATPARVFAAWADADARQTWMDDPDYESDGTDYELDFRVGGHERFGGLTPGGKTYRYDAMIYDIVPDRRIVYSYEMFEGDDRMSVSLTNRYHRCRRWHPAHLHRAGRISRRDRQAGGTRGGHPVPSGQPRQVPRSPDRGLTSGALAQGKRR